MSEDPTHLLSKVVVRAVPLFKNIAGLSPIQIEVKSYRMGSSKDEGPIHELLILTADSFKLIEQRNRMGGRALGKKFFFHNKRP